ncbi:unnamed protein product [Rotaria sp. Silwood2]|nr:unnamed protein product [Rotaria sp. Silwood2]CAF2521542.1 unnamed protein product [Rotaria sp. Silwood2]CAF2923797.1 unnamed protein product [Rotaria sp. Silwood2]CAF3858249.1 unnamed protein product [Rotaria sp. Silwood2]CAF3893264.1 unnamed protein product [Rotaria sp. Silwood2]
MNRLASLFVLVIIGSRSNGWYHGRTDLYDGDAEVSCETSTGSDIGRALPDEFRSDYSKIPKGAWFRVYGQIHRMSYDRSDSLLRQDDPQRQGNCYFQADAGMNAEYIQNIHFPRSLYSGASYNYFFSASMAGYDEGIQIQLEWYDERNELINSTSIHSHVPGQKMNSCKSM